MINFRNIFNPSYNYIGLLIILILIVLIIWLNHDIKDSLKKIGKTAIISGLITLIIGFLLNLIINNLVPYQYKIFIQVISQNVFNNLILASIVTIILGIILFSITKILERKQESTPI
ncbi:MAG: hypothetical protein MR598_00615 [Erysipelotrichaceae bacterium]|nr:hypothetical protein [Erysipelotrichaceae bacterium]